VNEAYTAPARAAVLIRAILALLVLAGCAGPEKAPGPVARNGPQWRNLAFDLVYEPKSLENASDTVQDWKRETWRQEMEFFTLLLDKPLASTADAATALTLFLGEPPWDSSARDLAARLVDMEIIAADWTVGEAEPLTKGKISYMICQALEIRGGFWMTLFGPSEKYCCREAVYLDIVSAGSLHRYVTGEELLNILSQAELYRIRRSGPG